VLAENRHERFDRAAARFAARVTTERRLGLAEARYFLALAEALPRSPDAGLPPAARLLHLSELRSSTSDARAGPAPERAHAAGAARLAFKTSVQRDSTNDAAGADASHPLVITGRVVTFDRDHEPVIDDGAVYIGANELIVAVQDAGETPPDDLTTREPPRARPARRRHRCRGHKRAQRYGDASAPGRRRLHS
jgi:hypothetical protein